MSIINTKSKLSKRLDKSDSDNKNTDKKPITNINSKKNTTYNVNPKSFRMTEDDISKLDDLTSKVIKHTGQSCTSSKVLRGLIYLSDDLDISTLSISIDKNT